MSGTTLFYPSPSEISETDLQLGLGEESKRNLDRYRTFIEHCREPLSRQKENLIQEFYRLAAQWKEETQYVSSISQISMNAAYQQIIGMGPDVIPLILKELKRKPAHWFWALKAITRFDPVPPQYRGNIEKMTEFWLKWGTEQGYVV